MRFKKEKFMVKRTHGFHHEGKGFGLWWVGTRPFLQLFMAWSSLHISKLSQSYYRESLALYLDHNILLRSPQCLGDASVSPSPKSSGFQQTVLFMPASYSNLGRHFLFLMYCFTQIQYQETLICPTMVDIIFWVFIGYGFGSFSWVYFWWRVGFLGATLVMLVTYFWLWSAFNYDDA